MSRSPTQKKEAGGFGYERRPDLVLYLNGIAVAVIELKRSSVEIADGVRQLITNQEPIFNLGFFPTVQLLFAGSDSQGLRYGILVVTDRDELDKQIEGVMKNAGVIGENSPSPRITSRAEFVAKLGATLPRLLCALIHKFDPSDLKGPPPAVHGRFYIFVDECHRTQGGDMNRQMKRWLENAIFIGFTGTPLLKKDAEKLRTRDIFGTYIHTYKFHEAVADKVVLDLKYEARDVPQQLTSQRAIDAWFDQKTRSLINFQKAILRKRWATLEELMSAGERKQRIIHSIIEDFSLKPRLNNDRGTAILVAASRRSGSFLRSRSIRPCGRRRRQAGRAMKSARSRCSMPFSRSWAGTGRRPWPFLRSSRTNRATDDRNHPVG